MKQTQIILGDCNVILKKLENNSVDSIVTDPPYGISFMNKHWDYDVPSIEIWRECLRVLKPGGHLLSFGGTRTYHRMACAIEDAGFEIRDIIAWVYGSGFPKSLNIGKAVDKLQGNEREYIGIKQYAGPSGNNRNFGVGNEDEGENKRVDTKGTSEYEGWWTALKPSLEPITVARKPLSEKTVAENCLKWGTGGINIDGCRVGTEEITVNRHSGYNSNSLVESTKGKWKGEQEQVSGRFPANLIHDGSDEVVSMFPNTKSGSGNKNKNPKKLFGTTFASGDNKNWEGDSGSASRFFYCAKASKRERNAGCEELEEKISPKDGSGLLNEKGEEKFSESKMRNSHPTVKPIALMEYIVKLVSREGAVVLDPFAGSGSTLLACKNLSRDYIGIEREADYIKIIKSRLDINIK